MATKTITAVEVPDQSSFDGSLLCIYTYSDGESEAVREASGIAKEVGTEV